MKTVTIVKQFVLTHNDQTRQQFAPGVYELEDHVADHPYVREHSDNPPRYNPAPGTMDAARAAAAEKARKDLLAAAIAQASEDDIKEAMAQQKEVVRRRVVTDATKRNPES